MINLTGTGKKKNTDADSGFGREKRGAGFTLLFAVLISTLLLTVGTAIFNITIKELLLSSSGRDSQMAFFSADTGIECALYWDFKQEAFSTSTSPGSVRCAGKNIAVAFSSFGPSLENGRHTFSIGGEECADVIIEKYDNPRKTIIESRGHNICGSSPRKVERALRSTY